MTDPLVTVLISTYNRPDTLVEALKSIYAQTYQNFEIRLTRDGGVPVSVWEFDDRLHFIDRAENKGLAYSFNQSIEQAQGEYVCYLGDDDLFYTDHIETLVRAIQANPEYGAVYSDLYQVMYRPDEYGNRRALCKNVLVQRDYDRMAMMMWNHVLHVSLMHRRDLFDKGVYNNDLTSLLDWDINRRMSFYTDFLHIPKVTGEYYCLYDGNERISTKERANPVKFVKNFLAIRHTRPPKPWGKMVDLSIIIPMTKFDKVINRTLRNIHIYTWFPHRVYLTCPSRDVPKIRTSHPNVCVLPLDRDYTEQECTSALEKHAPDGIKCMIKPDHRISNMWIEGIVNMELKG